MAEYPVSASMLTSDAEWRRLQSKTFARWINKHLKGTEKEVRDLQTDLSDGLNLLTLLEKLTGKPVKRYNKRPRIHAQKMENVELALDIIIKREGIRLINIGSGDIVGGNMKLIIGLIWSLITEYSILTSMKRITGNSSPRKRLTTKQFLIGWIQGKIPGLSIKNFNSDWNNGKAIGALVDAARPGLCPDWKTCDVNEALGNATKAMEMADRELGISQLLGPEDMVNPNVDELSMMTYLSQFLDLEFEEPQGDGETFSGTAEENGNSQFSEVTRNVNTGEQNGSQEETDIPVERLEDGNEKVNGEAVAGNDDEVECEDDNGEALEEPGVSPDSENLVEKVDAQEETAADVDENVEGNGETLCDEDKEEESGESHKEVRNEENVEEDQDEKVGDKDDGVETEEDVAGPQSEEIVQKDENDEREEEQVENDKREEEQVANDERVEEQVENDERVEEQVENGERVEEQVKNDEKVVEQDENGEKVVDQDENGEIVVDQDENGEIVVDQDENGEIVVDQDENGEKVVEQNDERVDEQDESGEKIEENIEQLED